MRKVRTIRTREMKKVFLFKICTFLFQKTWSVSQVFIAIKDLTFPSLSKVEIPLFFY